MNCRDARDKLELLALGGLPPEQERVVQAHVDRCPACCSRMAEYEFMLEELRGEAKELLPSTEFRQSLPEVTRSETAAARSRRRRSRFALAATFLAAVALTLFVWHLFANATSGGPDGAPALVARIERWHRNGLLATPRSDAPGYAVRGSTIYALRRRGERASACAIDAESGRLIWHSDIRSLGYLSADGSRVYCLSHGDGPGVTLLALDPADGGLLWSYSHRSAPRAPDLTRPLPAGDGQVCWTVGGSVYMLDASTGTPLWSRTVSAGGPLSGPAVDRNRVVFAGRNSVCCLDARDGHRRWRHDLPEDLKGQTRPLLALSGNRAFLVQRRYIHGADLFCMNTETRQIEWKRSVEQAGHLLATGNVVCLRGRGVAAFEAATGRRRWARPAEGCGPLTLADGLVQYVDSEAPGRVMAVDAETGQTGWHIAGVRSCDAFTRVGQTGYVKTRQGVLRAIALNTPPRR